MELLEKVLSKDNLNRAYRQVYKNKGASGVDGVTIDELFSYIREHQEEIQIKIRTRKYKPQPVRRVLIPKENGSMRKLGIPTVIDRVIQQAIVQVLTPIYEEEFSNNSYGFRPKRSCEKAIIKVLEYFNDGYDWIVDIDLQSFFDEVNQDKLIGIIRRKVKDGNLVSLIRKYLQSGVMENGVIQPTKKGTPQGGNLSPLLSNIMLNELDKELEKRGLNFVRYADDCLILVKSEKAANRVMDRIKKYITKKLCLKVNIEKSKVARPNEIKYLGFGFYKKNNQWRPKPHLKSIMKLKDKIKKITSRSNGKSFYQRVKELNYVIRGWINYFRIADMKKYMKDIQKHINHRLRMCVWKQWKNIRTRYKNLVLLKVNKEKARKTANCRKGYYYVSQTSALNFALSTKVLKERGLIMPKEYYLKVHIITN